jgi:hypothetical protein
MTIEELEVALARIDVMLGLLKREIGQGTNPQDAEDMTLLLRWRDDLDVEISLERLRQDTNTYRSPRRPSAQSWAAKSSNSTASPFCALRPADHQ